MEIQDLFDLPNEAIIPRRGDFSIIIPEFYRKSLQHDFNFLEQNCLWNCCDKQLLRNNFYYFHTDTTFKNNLFYLGYIHTFGWTDFIIKVENLNTQLLYK